MSDARCGHTLAVGVLTYVCDLPRHHPGYHHDHTSDEEVIARWHGLGGSWAIARVPDDQRGER